MGKAGDRFWAGTVVRLTVSHGDHVRYSLATLPLIGG
jgi:hypothetical protein